MLLEIQRTALGNQRQELSKTVNRLTLSSLLYQLYQMFRFWKGGQVCFILIKNKIAF